MTAAQAAVRELERSRTPELLETKLRPPASQVQSVRRDRLHERLQLDVGQRLALIAAPAGSGKTTLLGMWRECDADRRSIAWLTIDEGDRNPVVFWSYVLEALDRVSVAIDLPLGVDEVGPARFLDVLLPHVVNRLAEHGETTLVLDDFHRLSSGPSRESVAWLLEHAPPTFQLVVSSRNEPALPLAKLRAQGALLELRAQELGFTAAEADLLLNDRFELGLEHEYVEDLVARTEGWPAGLYLATLSLQGVDDRQAFVSRFGAENRHVVDFLVDEVLKAHDAKTQALMLRSSVLERLSGPLCDAVLEQKGSAEMLEALSRSNLFLMPLDDRGEWFRFHHLFGQLLRAELEHREPELALRLHRRASDWHRDHGSLDEAIGHALDAGAFAEAGELMANRWLEYANLGRFETVLSWLERFPSEVLKADAALLHALTCQARLLRAEGHGDAAAAAVARARASIDSCPDPGILGEWVAALEKPARARSGFSASELSEREHAVLRALTGPLSERDIGREFYLSHNTIHSHTRSIYRKLEVSSRADAVHRARELGLI